MTVAQGLERVLGHLAELVACDTRNPPRRITGSDPVFRYLGARLEVAGFDVALSDHGGGSVTLHARRGAPRLLWNFHLDTVPAPGEWSGPPLALRIAGERAIGRGACDVKGAAACALAAAEETAGPVALLFTSDEEGGLPRCVAAFLDQLKPGRCDGVIVAEPTGGRAITGHRGIATASGEFRGVAGHGSSPRALRDNALHAAVHWAEKAIALAETEESRAVGGLGGIRFNLGVLEGGEKPNMIAERARVRFGVRPRPGEDPQEWLARLTALAGKPERVAWTPSFVGPPLPAPGRSPELAESLAANLGIPLGDPVDFWTEASLFSAAGLPSVVFGPGDIAQAHAVEEWVALPALESALSVYRRAFSGVVQ